MRERRPFRWAVAAAVLFVIGAGLVTFEARSKVLASAKKGGYYAEVTLSRDRQSVYVSIQKAAQDLFSYPPTATTFFGEYDGNPRTSLEFRDNHLLVSRGDETRSFALPGP